jgi:thiol-disulfide isomerase/thioredoxin
MAVGALVVVQVAAFLAYRIVEATKGANARFDVERLSPGLEAPTVSFKRKDGSVVALADVKRPTLVHFWSTWCVPCRDELPALLAAADKDAIGASLVAVSVDESWRVVESFTDASNPAVVRLDHHAAKAAFSLGSLPQTFLVDGAGVMRAQFRGAQPWHITDEARRLITSLLLDGER